MTALLHLELIGDNWQAFRRASERGLTRPLSVRDIINIARYGNKGLVPWVARISPGGRRQFLHGVLDFSAGDSLGEHGIVRSYALEPGVYEVNECTGLGSARRYFVRVVGAVLVEIGREEVSAWQKSSSG